ncbi:MAG: hypothetical protein HYV20_15300 [Gemmatimonadetes bacterium]|nr:hypothetical protein [Gemmatimonadota bacterium]
MARATQVGTGLAAAILALGLRPALLAPFQLVSHLHSSVPASQVGTGLVAQGFRVSGRVVSVAGADSTPLAGTWAVLHQVSLRGGSPVDSARTDRGGRYQVRAAVRDTTTVYIVSVTYAGIAYFTAPLHARRGTSQGTAETLAVYDTSSTSPVVEMAQRHVIVRRPGADGARQVLELLVLRNTGAGTRIASDTARPVWQGALPRGAIELEVGESDVSAEAVYRRGDSIAVVAPVPPGEKQVVVSYVLPRARRALDLTVDQPIARLNLLVEDSAAQLVGDALERVESEMIEGTSFVRFAGNDVVAGAHVLVQFPRGRFSLGNLWWVVVALAGAALAAGLVLAWRRTLPAAASPLPGNPNVIAAEIAALDAAFEQRPEATPEERAAFQRRRAALKARLEELLSRP